MSSTETSPSAETSPFALRRQVERETEALRRRLDRVPQVAVIAESGLSALAGELEDETRRSFGETLQTSRRDDEVLWSGTLAGGVSVALMQARGLWEGFTARQVALPVRVLAALGAEAFVLLGEAAALRPRDGGTMLLSDHLNLQGANPLVGANEDAWGPRFPDMTAPYDADWRAAVKRAAVREDAPLAPSEGVYAAVPAGPTTPAERAMLQRMGAGAVGTGIVPEVLAARHMNRRVLAAARITESITEPQAESSDDLPDEKAASPATPVLATLMRVAARQAGY